MSASLTKNNKIVPAQKQAGSIRFNALSTPKNSKSPAQKVLPKKKEKPKRRQQGVNLMAAVRKSGNLNLGRKVPNSISLRTTPVKSPKGQTEVARNGAMSAEINSRKMEDRLKGQSPWYSSLRDPIQGAGARIPDAVGINTATLQLVQTASITTNAQGINGLYVRSPYTIQSAITVTNAPIWGPTTDATATAMKWGNETASVGYFSDWTSSSTIKAIAQSIRVVSAAVFAEYEGATISDQGEGTSFVLPYSTDSSEGFVTYADYQNHYGSSSVPVNKARTRPLVSYYFPMSYNSWEYTDFIDPLNFGYALVPVITGNQAQSPYWGMGHVFQGLAANTTVKYTMVINYEFIPLLNTIDYIGASASPIDAVEEQLVEQWITTDTQTGLANNKLVDVQPGSQKVDEASQGMTADNMFGMLGSVLSEIAPIVLAAL